jgi:hypothetical protein
VQTPKEDYKPPMPCDGDGENIITGHDHINDERIIEFIKQLILISALP